jgi:hypothetical protein
MKNLYENGDNIFFLLNQYGQLSFPALWSRGSQILDFFDFRSLITEFGWAKEFKDQSSKVVFSCLPMRK